MWALHARDLHLTTTLYKQGRKGKVGKKSSVYPAATEDALCEMAFQKAEEAIKGTRDAHERKVRKQGGTTPAVSSRWMGADRAMASCPVLAAIAASQAGRATRSTASATPAAPVADPEVRLFCKAEKHGTYIIGAAGVVKFLDNFFNHIQDKSLEDYFAKWTPYRVRRVHVKLIGRHDIYRPTPVLEGIKGTQSMYLFEGANSNTCDAQTTTASMEDDVFLALGVELASNVSSAEVESAGLSVRKVTGPVPSGVGREGGGLEEEEEGVRRGGRKRKKTARYASSDGEEEEEDEKEEPDSGSNFSGSEGEDTKGASESGSGLESEASEDGEGGSEQKRGVEMVCVRKVVLKHNLQTCLAACFGSACRLQHYDSCYTNALYPGLVPKYEAAVVKETVVMDTGVAPGGGGKKAKLCSPADRKPVSRRGLLVHRPDRPTATTRRITSGGFVFFLWSKRA